MTLRISAFRRRASRFAAVSILLLSGLAEAQPLPGTRDALFADANDEPAEVRWSCVDEFTLAYTYAKPRHWSRAVNRLAVDGRGELGAGAKWRLGARIDVDPVYQFSNRYRDDVRMNQRASAIWRETYIDFDARGWDFRVGAQNIVWGDVVGLFFADVVSARDSRDFLLPSFDMIRIPQWAVRAETSQGDLHAEFVWVPVPAFDREGKPGAEFHPSALSLPTSDIDASRFLEPERPARRLRHSNVGARVNGVVGGWDLAAFYYRSFAGAPTYYREAVADAREFVYRPRYDRIWQAGGTFNKDLGFGVVHGEAVYTRGQNHASTDPAASEGAVSRPTVDWIVSLDVPFTEMDGRLNLQAFQRVHLNGGDAGLAVKPGDFGVSAYISAKLAGRWEPQLLWIQTFGGGGGLIRPRLGYVPFKNASVGVGADIFTGPRDGYFGRYADRDRIYTEVRYSY